MILKIKQFKTIFWNKLLLILREARQFLIKLKPTPYWQQRFIQYSLLMRMDKPIGTLLLLWPTLWALWLASGGFPNISLLLIFTLGVFLTRSAGCVINDFVDRKVDGKVERTKQRPLVTQRVTEKEALILFFGLSILAFGLVLLLNNLSIYLSLIAITIVIIYPFTKRFTYFPQVVLGAAFSISIPMAFAAIQNEIPNVAWLLYISNLLWVLAYDTLYAMVDRRYDLQAGIKSTAILFGEADLAIVGLIQGFFIFGMILVGARLNLNYWYYLGLLAASCFIVWQLYLCRSRDPAKYFIAFKNNNWVGMSIFYGTLMSGFG